MRDIRNRYIIAALALAGLVLAPGLVWAQGDATGVVEDDLDEAVEEDLDSGDAAEKPWSVSATLLTRVYQGMFVDLQNQDDELSAAGTEDPSHAFDRWLNLYVLSGGYTLGDFSLGAEFVASHWMTPGGGLNSPYEMRLEDTTLSASWAGYTIEPIDTTVSASYSVVAPTSVASQAVGLIAANSLGVKVSKTFVDNISLSYSLGGSWLPHRATSPQFDEEVVDIYRPNEKAGNAVAVEGVNTEYGLTNSLAASFPIWGDLSGSVNYSITKYWTYDRDNDDDKTSPNAKVGRGTVDLTTATASLSYKLHKHVSLAAGVRTRQQPKTADNSAFRFPWWNFEGAAGNTSAVQMSVTGSY
jgi:hypothetical protein